MKIISHSSCRTSVILKYFCPLNFFCKDVELLFKGCERWSEFLFKVHKFVIFQLKTYYESNEDVNPPLKLEPCILAQGEQVYLAEPLVGMHEY